MFKPLVCLGVLLTIATSCTIKPGEYRVYRMAKHGISLGCQFKNPDDFETDNYFDPAIIAIYATDDNTYFLEDAANSFVGTRSGKDYVFQGEYQRQRRFDEDEGFTRNFSTSERLQTLYQLTVNNKEIFGSLTEARTDNCGGSNDDCDKVQVGDRICTDVYEVFGSEVDEAEVGYGLVGGGLEGGHGGED